MATKPKTPQPQTPTEVQGRDRFETPAYATKLLLPFIPYKVDSIWECAAGSGRIARVLEEAGYVVLQTDLLMGAEYDFLTMGLPAGMDALITNPPYSLKEKFFLRALDLKIPFAFLIPADYSGWVIRALKDHGAQKVIPTRRIDYYTPDTVELVWRGMTLDIHNRQRRAKGMEPLKKSQITDDFWKWMSGEPWAPARFPDVDSIPLKLVAKYSAAQFHSMWLTWGFDLGSSEVFVELTSEMKKGEDAQE